MHDPVILSAARTAIGKFQGALSSFTAPQLGAFAVKEALARSGVPAEKIDEVIMGSVLQAGLGQNPARQAALGAGLPDTIAAFTLNKVCGSSLKAVMVAAQAIKAADSDFIIAGGMESMTNAPYLLPKAREGIRLGHGEVVDSVIHDGLWDKYNNYHMGCTGEIVSKEWKVTRAEADEFSVRSHQRAAAAMKSGAFAKEIFTVEIPQRKGESLKFVTDEGVRADSSLEGLAKMKAAFEKDGTVTAGNASQLSDGASAVVVACQQKAEKLGFKPLAKIVAYATAGLAPKYVMMAPEKAVRMIWEKTGWGANDVDLYELNEAFAVQGVALTRVLGLDPEKVNVNGGAVALGHPIGASGTRVLTTLLYALQARGGKRGIASLCLGGGNAVAMAIELI